MGGVFGTKCSGTAGKETQKDELNPSFQMAIAKIEFITGYLYTYKGPAVTKWNSEVYGDYKSQRTIIT